MKIKQFDTIVSIATSFAESSIAIIRISGDRAFAIADKIFTPFAEKKKEISIAKYTSHTITYGIIKDNEEILDEVLLTVMKAPKTYTKEDIIEINCHGGLSAVKRILELIIKNGARLAERGEFTKRAFLNGRIDLSRAEAVLDIINARTSYSHKAAINRLTGKLYQKIKSLRESLLEIIANIEASIDYPEYDEPFMLYSEIKSKILAFKQEIQNLLKTADTGKIINEGISTVILGRPNVGKSSVLNFLLDEDRAIVSDIAGTTRDILKENLNISGIYINIIDTAGIRNTEDKIEKAGVLRAKKYAQNADLILLVLDGSKEITKEDIDIISTIKNKKIIAIINKIDLEQKIDEKSLENYIQSENIIKISAKKNIGLEDLINKIEQLFIENEINFDTDILISNERNKESLINADKSISNAIDTLEKHMPIDLLSSDIMDSYSFLGEIIGESIGEDVIDKIFSEFCLGK